jgi:hypothetical protein
VSRALRITGHLDPVALQAALDDVVARHELLRTIVRQDARPPCQQVHPPMPVPLTVHDMPPMPHPARDEFAAQQLIKAEASSIDVEQLPLLRAELARFDSRDSVLSLVAHHSACDGWSMNLLLRDLTGYYAARTGERPLTLPEVRSYQDYVSWQHAEAAQSATAKLAYWYDQLDGARVFTLPADRTAPAEYTAPYLRQSFVIDADVAAAFTRFAKAEHCSGFMITLAALAVLAHRIRGTADPAIITMFHGRLAPQFRNTVGWFVNFPSMRIRLAGCRSFRDVVLGTRVTCLQAYEHDLPNSQIAEAIPSLREPLADPHNSHFVFSYWDSSLAGATGEPFQIGDSADVVRKRERVSEQLPGGAALIMGMAPSGVLSGGLQFSPEEFDEGTVDGWISDYCQILARAMTDPDRPWLTL